MKKDNSTFARKVAIRQNLLAEIADPVVLETHAGAGVLWARCYTHCTGIAFEIDATKARALAIQRPTWAVYQANSAQAIKAGAGSHLIVNFLDCDPYGSPWPTINAFFSSERKLAPVMGVVVNDGLRLRSKRGGLWVVDGMGEAVAKYGNDGCYEHYLEIAREMLVAATAQVGYTLRRWAGYYCGHAGQMTHYAAVLERGQ